MFRAVLAVLAGIAVLTGPLGRCVRAEEPPTIVVSIKPIHSLVAAIMAGVGKPELIVTDAVPADAYSLKPSDAAILAHARLIFWIGPMAEKLLAQPLAEPGGGAELVQLADARGVNLLPVHSGKAWEHAASDTPADADTPPFDGHLWLDPKNARAMAAVIAAKLTAIDPANAGRYTANAAGLYRRLDALDAALERKLAPLRGKPFLVFNDAFQYLTRRYGLAALGSIDVDPQAPPDPVRLEEIHHMIRVAGAHCVFGGPDSPPSLIQAVTEETDAHGGSLDPDGLSPLPGPELYFTLMDGIADALAACLGPPGLPSAVLPN